MPIVRKRIRLSNPPRRRVTRKRTGRRKMTAKQIKYFGTKRQKAALKASRRRKTTVRSTVKRAVKRVTRKRRTRRQPNVGEILTIGLNPGRTTMARATRRRRTTRRKRRNPTKTVVYRYRTRARTRRRRNPSTRRYSRRRVVRRRRNPAMLTGTFRSVVGVLGGATVTKLIVDRLPISVNTGIVSYLSTAVVAIVQGWAVGKFGKNRALGEAMTLGGMTYLGLRILQDFAPGIGAVSSIGLQGRGMGLIAPSSFYQPQVPRNNMYTSFVTPSAVSAAVASAGMGAIGRRVPRGGRLN